MRALIVGANGFVGRWLLRHLVDSGDSVVGIVGPHFEPPLAGAELVERIDVLDRDGVARFVAATEPDAIYYLAGISQRGNRDSLEAAAGISVVGSMNVLMAASAISHAPRILFASTGLVYQGGNAPLAEDAATQPSGLYAAGKLAAERALGFLAAPAAVEVVVAQAFNHIGPGQSQAFLVPSVARQVAAVVAGETDVVRIRASTPVRDYCDVRDVVRAYRLLVTRGVPGRVYNVASGTGVSSGQVAQMLIDAAGVVAAVQSSTVADEGDQPPVLIGDAARLGELGWKIEYSLGETLAAVLADHLPDTSGIGQL